MNTVWNTALLSASFGGHAGAQGKFGELTKLLS
jgi:hypothetical protein